MSADPEEAGYQFLARGEWENARSHFETALRGTETAERLDGLGQALWWLKDVDTAIHFRQRAYTRFRESGNADRAARIAIWLSREYSAAFGNQAAASGWLSRAETLLPFTTHISTPGWIALAKSEQTLDASSAADYARAALENARDASDADLEILALAQVGLTGLYFGNVDEGMIRFDEAMAAATANEARNHQTFGEVCCKMVYACEVVGDVERMGQWAQVVDDFMRQNDHLPLLAFCGSCCAEMFTAAGHVTEAESELLKALAVLEQAGQPGRCVHPAARLAELRILQGRLEEGDRLLDGYSHLPEGLRALISLRLAQGDVDAAIALATRRLTQIGQDSLLSAPFLSLLIDAHLADGNVSDGRKAADQLMSIAQAVAQPRLLAEAEYQFGRLLVASGDAHGTTHLERSLELYSRLGNPLQMARVRFTLGLALEVRNPSLAIEESRAALKIFEELGSQREADAAAELLRRLGVAGRTGPKHHGLLSKRELEVLQLLGEGFTNAEIADRLFISTKTASNHVSNVLSKLLLRNRAEAAAYAQRYLAPSAESSLP